MRNKKKKIMKRILYILIFIIIILIATYNYFYGKTKYISGGIKITSTCTLEQTANEGEQTNQEEPKKALFTLLLKGITRDEFLQKYDVLEISVNGENVNLENAEYIHLNKALSIRVHSENYKEGNIIEMTLKDKSKLQEIKKRLYNTTEIVVE